MLTNSLVSLVIPIHGEGLYLSDTLTSVESISYQNLEVLLVLDRPSSSAREKATDFCNKNDKSFVLESAHPGISEALNLGIQKASGTYIARLDSDDMIFPERIARQAFALDNNKDLVLVGTQMQIINEDNLPIRKTCYPTSDRGIKNLMGIRNCIGHPTVMMRKATVLRAGGYRSEFNGAEDLDLWLRLAPLGKFVNLNEALTAYRISRNQITNSLKKHPGELEERILIKNLEPSGSSEQGSLVRRIGVRAWLKLRAIRILWKFDSTNQKGFIFRIAMVTNSFLIYPTGTFRFCLYALRIRITARRQSK